jgi:hypothetical protein
MIDASMVTEMTPMSSRVAAALALLGFLKAGHPVGDRLHPGERGAPRGEGPQQQEHGGQPHRVVPWLGDEFEAGARGLAQGAGQPLDEPPHTAMPMMPNMKA